MRSAIIYYSFSGNTKKVAEVLSEHLNEKGEAALIELKDFKETGRFFVQAARAFKHAKTLIPELNLDLSSYDIICFGSPVWAFAPAPAMNTYLDRCFGLGGKEIILFTTYGSGTGNGRCLKYMQDILSKKGVNQFKKFSVQQFKVKDRDSILSKIKEVV